MQNELSLDGTDHIRAGHHRSASGDQRSITVVSAPPEALEDLARKRKLAHSSLLSDLEQLQSTIQSNKELPTDERRRKMAIVYSRRKRKRIRQNQQVDNLTEICVSQQEKNQQIRVENEKLEFLLIQAQAIVAMQMDPVSQSGECEYERQLPLAPSSPGLVAKSQGFDQTLYIPDSCTFPLSNFQPHMHLPARNQLLPVAIAEYANLIARTLAPPALDPYAMPFLHESVYRHIPFNQEQQCFLSLGSVQDLAHSVHASGKTDSSGHACSVSWPTGLSTVQYPPSHEKSSLNADQIRSQRKTNLLQQVDLGGHLRR